MNVRVKEGVESVVVNITSHCVSKTPPHVKNESKEDIPVTTSVAKTKNSVLLQTACSRAYGMYHQLVPVRVLLDSESQRSYITDSQKTQLKLAPLRQE